MDAQTAPGQDNIKKEPQTPKANENGDAQQNSFQPRGRGGFRGRGSFRGNRGHQMNAGRGDMQNDEEMHMNDRPGSFRGRGRGRGRGGYMGPDGPKFPQDRVLEKLKALAGPMVDLPPREEGTKKFSNHCRLWIGNLPLDIGDDEVKELFKPYGEFDEVYFDKSKGFAFVRMDFKSNAERAKQELHLKDYKGRQLKIRFSNPGTGLKVRNLSAFVTNELLEKAFGVFGELEKCIVITDDRGKPTGDGIIEYCKKPCALLALKKCQEGCFFLTMSPRPVIVEPLAVFDENDGMCEININKRNPEYMKERQTGPRFAAPGSFEFEYGLKWKQLYELFDKKKEMLDKDLADEKKKLEEQIEYAKYQHETELLREQLRQREEMTHRQKADYENRQREWEEHRKTEEDRQRRIEEELSMKFRQQEEELRRRQEENRQFMQERGNELKNLEMTDGFGMEYGDGNNWRRNADNFGGQGGSSWRGGAGESWGARGGGQRGGGQGWVDGSWDGRQDPWQEESRGYGRSDQELPPPEYNEEHHFEKQHDFKQRENRNRWGREREDYGSAKRARY